MRPRPADPRRPRWLWAQENGPAGGQGAGGGLPGAAAAPYFTSGQKRFLSPLHLRNRRCERRRSSAFSTSCRNSSSWHSPLTRTALSRRQSCTRPSPGLTSAHSFFASASHATCRSASTRKSLAACARRARREQPREGPPALRAADGDARRSGSRAAAGSSRRAAASRAAEQERCPAAHLDLRLKDLLLARLGHLVFELPARTRRMVTARPCAAARHQRLKQENQYSVNCPPRPASEQWHRRLPTIFKRKCTTHLRQARTATGSFGSWSAHSLVASSLQAAAARRRRRGGLAAGRARRVRSLTDDDPGLAANSHRAAGSC